MLQRRRLTVNCTRKLKVSVFKRGRETACDVQLSRTPATSPLQSFSAQLKALQTILIKLV